jgi:hypothetical protein
MDNETTDLLLLIAGLLLLFIGLWPILSKKHFDEMSAKFWHKKNGVISEKDAYVYNRYVRQFGPIIVGLALLAYSLNKVFG